MDNRLFIRKCFICGEPSTEEKPLYEYISRGNNYYDLTHEKCWEEDEVNKNNTKKPAAIS